MNSVPLTNFPYANPHRHAARVAELRHRQEGAVADVGAGEVARPAHSDRLLDVQPAAAGA